MKVLIDTQILIFLHPKPADKLTKEQKELHVRARILAEELGDRDAQVLVPTVCVSEYLVGCDQSTWPKVTREFSERFMCPDFDLPSAQMAAKVRQSFAQKHKGSIYKDRRNVLSADTKILGIALANGVQELYSHDREFRILASDFIKSFDLPQGSKNLYLEQFVREQIK